jgi:hypothetical protein
LICSIDIQFSGKRSTAVIFEPGTGAMCAVTSQ